MRFILIKIKQFRKWNHNRKVKAFNILTGWGIENNIDDLMVTGLTENEVVFPIAMPTYTLKLDLNLPFDDDRIGTVIINDIEYVKKEQKCDHDT